MFETLAKASGVKRRGVTARTTISDWVGSTRFATMEPMKIEMSAMNARYKASKTFSKSAATATVRDRQDWSCSLNDRKGNTVPKKNMADMSTAPKSSEGAPVSMPTIAISERR